jgi:hypothetical protein
MMLDPYHKKLAHPTDAYEDDFFSDAPLVGVVDKSRAVVWLTKEPSVALLKVFLENDFLDAVPFSDAAAFNGFGRRGTFVRFRFEEHTLEDVMEFLNRIA